MILSHYSYKPITALRDGDPQRPRWSAYEKPRGFWVSVDGENDWAEWCSEENFGSIAECFRYRITLADNANILTLSKGMPFLSFEKEYGERTDYHDLAINWERVAQKFDGIIIAPYHWEHRMSSSWYYSWDCASGCIWKARAIASFTLLEAPQGKAVAAV